MEYFLTIAAAHRLMNCGDNLYSGFGDQLTDVGHLGQFVLTSTRFIMLHTFLDYGSTKPCMILIVLFHWKLRKPIHLYYKSSVRLASLHGIFVVRMIIQLNET